MRGRFRSQPKLVIMEKTGDSETTRISVLDSIAPMDDDLKRTECSSSVGWLEHLS